MRFFSNSDQSGSPNATGFKGFYYHFLDIRTGVRVWQSELSMIDTALLVAGVLMTSMYFTAETADEVELRELADFLYRRIDWQWAQSDSATRFGKAGNLNADFCTTDGRATAKPSCFTCLPWVPPPHPIVGDCYKAWTATDQWEKLYDHDNLYAGPLFVHHFSHAWIDFRGIRDRFMREKHSDYFENSRHARDARGARGVALADETR